MNKSNWPISEWQVVKPESVGMNPEGLHTLDEHLASHYNSVNGIVAVSEGQIFYEKYNGNFNKNDVHSVASVTKSILSALIGIAIDKGYIEDVQQKVLTFFPECVVSPKDVQKRHITIEHLLTMTAPFAWNTRGNTFEPIDRLRRQPDWIDYILNIMGKRGQIGTFQYCTAATHLLSAVISRATGVCARQFANEHLFAPIGMTEIPDRPMKSFSMDDVFGSGVSGWVKDPQGHSTGGWGLTVSPRDMARFGLLYLRKGQWDGKRVVSEQWINASVKPNVNNYGYMWWLDGSGKSSAFVAAGAGGNHIYCLPDLDLVVAIASKNTGKAVDRSVIIERYIVPSLIDSKPLFS